MRRTVFALIMLVLTLSVACAEEDLPTPPAMPVTILIPLQPGWNVLTVPSPSIYPTLEVALRGIREGLVVVWSHYDDGWRFYAADPSVQAFYARDYSQMDTIETGREYSFFMKKPATLFFASPGKPLGRPDAPYLTISPSHPSGPFLPGSIHP